ncbi:metallophosphoesterase domain-containing protein [Paracoccidioides lutzii Pb01]|uniref:Metallophosphoesterase domain-containing protein n=1 Tax=Paracoccidioides lutzii (strain ATCC MYA-826 / Pb01) TaxID=502779 RepID=C1GP20_PARBA|nr:metallophosphoesterase domain-containing protein [Paracoccidioides lutzii Pb01]EEH35942.1 metallophosphoesterase domain-containing protein [Paracoccidioides lutzii Pb01]
MAATSSSGEVKTRFCLISDTHTYTPLPPDNWSPFRHPFPAADVLLHAGDLTMVGKGNEHQATIGMLKSAEAELKIVIAGNHDITLDEDYYNSFGHRRHQAREDLVKIRDMYCGEEARRHGIVYMDEGVRTFRLKNGAQFTVYASPYQPEFCRWAFAYKRPQDRFNPPQEGTQFVAQNPIPDFPAVDVILTHGPPRGVMDETISCEAVGCDHLRRAVTRAKPRLHCFGHIHEGYGAQRMEWAGEKATDIKLDQTTVLRDRASYINVSRDGDSPLRVGEETLFVNASIVTVQYDPVHAPWVVDIDLPCSTEA